MNLLLLIVFGTAVSGWLLYFTDWFETFGGLLALGGVFSWLAFVSKLLPEERLKAMQKALDERFFSNARWRWPLAIGIAIFLAVASFVGTVEVRSAGEPRDRLLWTSDEAGEMPDRLAAGTVTRIVTWTTPWRGTSMHVRVSGYPPLTVRVFPWQRAIRDVPASFRLTPVILLQPAPGLMQYANTGLQVIVQIRGQPYVRPFDGRTIWVGCDADVEVPDPVVDVWRSRFAAHLPFWSHPASVTEAKVVLEPHETIQVSLMNAMGGEYGTRQTIVVGQPRSPDDFPQIEVLHEAGS